MPKTIATLFSFEGRATRRAYLVAAGISYVVICPLQTIYGTCASVLGLPSEPGVLFWPALSRLVQPFVRSESAALIAAVASWLGMVVTLVVMLAFGVRRLRDANLSGWYVLAPLLLPAMLPSAAHTDLAETIIEVLCDVLLISLPPTDRAWRAGPIVSEPARQKPVEVF